MKQTALFFLSLTFFSCSTSEEKIEVKEEKKVILNQSTNDNLDRDVLGIALHHFAAISTSPKGYLNEELVTLGKVLFFDTRLSKDGNISCNSCHNLETFGVDNLSTSPGDENKKGDRNSPTVLNAADHIAQFWDGRAKTIEDQAGMPILNPVEMNIPNEEFLIDRLSKIELYKNLFAFAFPGKSNPINYDNLKTAIGGFERTLTTPSRFDEFMNGNQSALTNEEKSGMALFAKSGCVTCHNGKLLGGSTYQKFGVHQDYWTYTSSENIDVGKFKVTNDPADKYVFKVPGLRNIAGTYPYFHDGSIKDLEEAVWIMGKVQLDVDFSSKEVDLIVKFLKTLDGKLPTEVSSSPKVLAQK